MERIPDGGVKPRRAPRVIRSLEQMASDPIEIVYERPSPPARWWVTVAGGVVFAVVVLWVTARALPGPGWFALAVLVTLAVFGVQSAMGGGAVLATRRVTVDPAARTLRIEHRRGERVLALGDITGVAHGKVTSGDGVALDAVTLTLAGGGATLAFGVASPETAEGAARAVRALLVDGSIGAAGDGAGVGQSA